MTTLTPSHRLVEALAEAGHTRIGARTAVVLIALVAATLIGVPMVDGLVGDSPRWLATLATGLDEALSQPGPREANWALNRSIERAEVELEEGSWAGSRLRPWTQWLVTLLGAGNEESYLGTKGWLFYRPDVDYAMGRGFLAAEAQAARAASARPWEPAVESDPIPALIDLRRQLAERGIHLLVLPIPVKSTVVPHRFHPDAGRDGPAQNPSFDPFLDRLRAEQIDVLDPTSLLAALEDPYLRTDSHWTPAGLAVVAESLAGRLEALGLTLGAPEVLSRRSLVVEGVGDLERLLGLPESRPFADAKQQVEIQRVESGARAWRPRRDGAILLLGDSFSNIYSDPALGWGAGAGLAEQLSFLLRRPVDRIAINAGGASEARRRLALQPDRLDGKRVVIYEFATRELAIGDWPVVDLGP